VSLCQRECAVGILTLCKTNAECDGGTCKSVTCNGGTTLYACNTTNACK
jgi:hypothetical protein